MDKGGMGKLRVSKRIGLLGAFAPIAMLVVIVASASDTCGKRGGEKPIVVRYGIDEHTWWSPSPVLGRHIEPVPPTDYFTSVGCDRPFPTVGTRFVEERDDRRVPVQRGTMWPPEIVKERIAITIDEASGSIVSDATFMAQSWSDEDHAWPDDPGSVSTWIGDKEPIVGPGSLSAAIPRASVPVLERAVALIVASVDRMAGPDTTRVHLSPPHHEGLFDTFDVEATWDESMVFHAENATLTGKLVLRAADGALVDLSLEGVAHTSYARFNDSASADIRVKKRVSRPCFKTPIVK
jgi:hypothetical protein